MKSYHIQREGTEFTDEVTVIVKDSTPGVAQYELKPDESLKQRNHSPTGFNFGYGGSGPAQLALAILMDYTRKVPHPAMYQTFKFQFLETMNNRGGTITGIEIDSFINGFDGTKFMPPGEKP